MGKKERGWVSIRALADVLGIAPQTARQTHVRRLDPEHVRKGSRHQPTQVFGPAVVQAIIDRATTQRDSDADPLLSDGNGVSDNLEEYRKWKAAMARLEYEKAYETLVGKDMVRDNLTLAAEIIRRAGDRLDQTHGPAARETLLEALDDFEKQIAEEYGVPDAQT